MGRKYAYPYVQIYGVEEEIASRVTGVYINGLDIDGSLYPDR